MSTFEILALLISLTALFAYLNKRFIGLPTVIGGMLVALILSLGLVLFGGGALEGWAEGLLQRLDFDDLVLRGLLSFLLFAGALNVNLENLNRLKWPILLLATAGVLLSTFVVGGLVFLALRFIGLELPFLYALVFGALISPTDPVAVLAILKQVGIHGDTEALVVGESLFNDGVGVVIFSVIVGLVAADGHAGGPSGVALLFAQEALGGAVFGLALGLGTYALLRRIDDYTVEILITLAVVTGGYALAQALHTSGPLAIVVAGLFIGNRGRLFAMTATTREHLDAFWVLIDEILNAVLFVLIGLELLVLDFSPRYLLAALLAVPLVLAARLLSVGLPIGLFRLGRTFRSHTVRIMVWGGLRGGISVALALSLPASMGLARDLLLTMTYGVVVFSILVQGLTIGRVARASRNAP